MRLVRVLIVVVLAAAMLLSVVDGLTPVAGFNVSGTSSASSTSVVISGLGEVYFAANTGGFITLSWMDVSLVSPLPEGDYPYGFFSFAISGLSPDGTVIREVVFPGGDLPEDVVWVKVEENTYRVINVEAAGATLTLTLTADQGGNAVDPGGPGVLAGPTPGSLPRPVGGFIEPADKLAVFAPYLALFGIVATIAVVIAAPWKKPDN
jgi:hypothetical protein